MSDLSTNEYLEWADTLIREKAPMRKEADDRLMEAQMYRLPKLPKSMMRQGEHVYMLSPEVIFQGDLVRSHVLSFQTEIGCVPTARDSDSGNVPAAHKRKADALEPGGALFWNTINPNRRLEGLVTWDMLFKPLSLVVMEFCGVTSPKPEERGDMFRAYTISLEGTGWEEMDGVPTVFARRYKKRYLDVRAQYGGSKSGPNAGKAPKFDGSKIDGWEEISDAYPLTVSRSSAHAMEELEIVSIMTPTKLCHIAVNKKAGLGPLKWGKESGELLWEAENPFGRVPVFLVSASETNMDKPEAKRAAFLLPAIVNEASGNVVDSTRATASRNRVSERQYVQMPPEAAAAAITSQWKPTPITWEDGKVQYVEGKIETPPIPVDPDTENIAAKIEQRRERYSVNALANLRTADVTARSTAAAYLGNLELGMQAIAPVTGALDVLRREMLECWEDCIEWIAKNHGPKYAEMVLSAGADADYLRGTNFKGYGPGSVANLKPETFDFPHSWRVSTHSDTLAQRQAELMLVEASMAPLPNGMPNVGILDDLMKAVREPDPTARKQQIFKETSTAAWGIPLLKSRVEAGSLEVLKLRGLDLGPLIDVAAMQQQADPLGRPPPPDMSGPKRSMGNREQSPLTNPVETSAGPAMGAAGA